VNAVAVDPRDPDPSVVEAAAAHLRAGELVIYPTDTLYALGAVATDGRAAARVRAAKGRDDRKPLPLIAADPAQARGLCQAWPEAARRLADRFWPGPLTLVLAAGPHLPAQVTAGANTVAVRVPALAVARRLCAAAGAPLVSTSANLSGAPPALTCAEALAAVGPAAAFALDGGPGTPRPSTIVDLTVEEPRLLREGAVAWPQVLAVLLQSEP
jgi:L-threonylcarbamoyladenylate synthase